MSDDELMYDQLLGKPGKEARKPRKKPEESKRTGNQKGELGTRRPRKGNQETKERKLRN